VAPKRTRPERELPETSRPSPARAAAAALVLGRVVRGAGGLEVASEKATALFELLGSPRPDLRVVRRPSRLEALRRSHPRISLVLGALAAVAVAFGLVYVHVRLEARQMQLNQLESRVQAEQATYQDLRVQVARLSSPANVAAEAEGRLGMVMPTKVVYLRPTVTVAGDEPSSALAPVNQPVVGDASWPQIKASLAGGS